jgi:hypothetical protein
MPLDMMKPFLQPHDEYQRHEALLHYCILDSETGPPFDDLVRLATQICVTPATYIGLIDHPPVVQGRKRIPPRFILNFAPVLSGSCRS